MSEKTPFNPNWDISPDEKIANLLSVELSQRVELWAGATDEELIAVARAVRRAVIEECAKVADARKNALLAEGHDWAANQFQYYAEDIRALAND